MEPTDTSLLTVTNVLLAIGCLALSGTVVAGVVAELVARRRLRRSLPDCWPPEPEGGAS